MSSLKLVQRYFDHEANRFDAIYERQKPFHQRAVDALFRRVVVERFRLVTNLAPVKGSWMVLDVGCGSGRYAIDLALKGAAKVVGVDVSQTMLSLASREAMKAEVAERTEFVAAPFLEYETDERFDVSVAMGYFDYLEDPLPHLLKMKSLCEGRIFASFPKRWEIRTPLRKLRFFVERGFVRFYSRREIGALTRAAGIPDERVSLIDLGRDWIAVIHT
jgi:2-polyprenyl-3-methyl-5-hydroxy-6-metoxy-1,4-benzoquinol methylase